MGMTILDLVRQAKERPAQTVGEKSLVTLEAFLSGIFDGLEALGKSTDERGGERFDFWLAKQNRLPISKDLFSTLTLITPNDSVAFDLFFEKIGEFLEQRLGPTIWSFDLPCDGVPRSESDLDLSPLLLHLKKQPYPLLRGKSLRLLVAYLNGHFLCRTAVFGEVQCMPRMDQFGIWLQSGFSTIHDHAPYQWHRILMYISDRREQESGAFDLFFNLYEKWERGEAAKDAIAAVG